MPKFRRDVQPLLDRAIDSLTLAIEIFNRPAETGRTHAVPMLLHHAFELGLKAAILQRGRPIHDKTSRYTFGFDKCLAVAEEELNLLSKDERATLSILDAHRDTAVHHYADMSEDVLYVLAQSSVTLFDRLLGSAFKEALADRMPTRVLPVSARPPRDLHLLLGAELTEVDDLLKKGRRQGAQAAAKLRSILAFATAARDDAQRVAEDELANAIARRRKGAAWEVILPEVAHLKLSTEGSGIPVTMKISKQGSIPIRIAEPGELVEGVVVKQEVNPFDKYNLGRDDLATKLGLSGPRTSALIIELEICDDAECYRELKIKSQVWKRYSPKALNRIRQALAVASTWTRSGESIVRGSLEPFVSAVSRGEGARVVSCGSVGPPGRFH